jgi:DNA repair protein RadC
MEGNTNFKPFSIRGLPAYERPRERLSIHGSQVLSAAELLQLLLSTGSKTLPVGELSHLLLAKFGSLQALSEATLEELCQVAGLGQAKACQIQACFEIARRLYSVNAVWEKLPVLTKFSTSEVVALIRSKISSYRKEHFLIASFDVRNRLIACDLLSIGILNASLVHPRETFIPALKHHASFVVVGHNHPSGDLEPSEEDLAVTARLEAAGKILGIELFDHVIVGKKGYVSFREQNLL